MRSLLGVVLVLAACGDDAPVDPHELRTCDQTWINNGYDRCEAACVASATALTAMGPACEASTSIGTLNCSKTFVFSGVTGCCATSPGQVLFGECE